MMIFTDIIDVFLILAIVRHQQVFMCILAMKLVSLEKALRFQGLFAAYVTVHFPGLVVFAVIVLYAQLDSMLKMKFAMLVLQVYQICEKHIKYTCYYSAMWIIKPFQTRENPLSLIKKVE